MVHASGNGLHRLFSQTSFEAQSAWPTQGPPRGLHGPGASVTTFGGMGTPGQGVTTSLQK
jgi:hypothetical protein